MLRPDRIPVAHTFGVVPHAVAVDDLSSGLLRDVEHAPVDVVRHAADHVLGQLSHPLRRPVTTHSFEIATDPAVRKANRHFAPKSLATIRPNPIVATTPNTTSAIRPTRR